MATSQVVDTASFTYTPLGGTSTVHNLRVPLLISPAYQFGRSSKRRRWEAWTSDYRTREVYSLSNGVEEIVGQVRFDDEPVSLMTMLEEALYNNVTLTYSPNGSDTYPVKVVAIQGAPNDEVRIFPDSNRYGYGEWMVPLVLRRVDGGTFDTLVPDAT